MSAWSKSGDSLAAGCGAVVKVWAGTEPGVEVKLFEGTPVFCLAFSPNNKVLAVGGDKGAVSLYSASPAPGSGERSVGTIPPLPEAGLEAVAALTFLPDTSLVTGGRHGGLDLWALRSQQPTKRSFPGLSGAATALAAPPGLEALAAASSSGQVLLFDTRPGAAGRARSLAPPGGPAVRVLAASAGGLLAAGNDAGGLLVWDLDGLGQGGSGASATSLTGHKGAVTGLAWGVTSPHLLISCGSDGRLRGTDRRTHQPVWSVACRLPLSCLSLKWDGSLLAVGTAAGSVLVYDARSPGQPLAVQQFSDASVAVSCVAWQHKYSSRSSSKASAAAAAAPAVKAAPPAPTPPPVHAPPGVSAEEASPAAAGLTPEASSGSLHAEGCGMMRPMSPVQLYGDEGDADAPAAADGGALHTPAGAIAATPATSAASGGAAAFMFTPGLGLPGAWGGNLPTPEMGGGAGAGASGAPAGEPTPISRPVAVRAPPASPPLAAVEQQPAAAPPAAASQANRNGRERDAGAGKAAAPAGARQAALAAAGRGGWNSSSVVQQQPAAAALAAGGPGVRAGSRTPGGTPAASRRASRSEADAALQQQQQHGGSGGASSSRPGSASAAAAAAAAAEPLPARPGSAAAAAAAAAAGGGAGLSEEVFRSYVDEQMAALRQDIKAMHLDMLRSFHQAQMDLVSVVDGLVARQDALADGLAELGAAVAGMRAPKAGGLQQLGPLPWI